MSEIDRKKIAKESEEKIIKSMKIFTPHGPFPIKIKEDGSFDVTAFWAEHNELSKQHGCYIFAIEASKGIKPWYVGKTSRTFKEEVFIDRNLAQFYYPINNKTKKGTPVFLFASEVNGAGSAPADIISELETFLIQQGKNANPQLKNTQGVTLPKFGIQGVIRGGAGKITQSAKKFKTCMAIE